MTRAINGPRAPPPNGIHFTRLTVARNHLRYAPNHKARGTVEKASISQVGCKCGLGCVQAPTCYGRIGLRRPIRACICSQLASVFKNFG